MDNRKQADEFMQKYVRDRDDALFIAIETDSVKPFKDFVESYKPYGIYPPCFELASDEVIEITIRKMAYHCINLPQEVRDKAEAWLKAHGSNTDLD